MIEVGEDRDRNTANEASEVESMVAAVESTDWASDMVLPLSWPSSWSEGGGGATALADRCRLSSTSSSSSSSTIEGDEVTDDTPDDVDWASNDDAATPIRGLLLVSCWPPVDEEDALVITDLRLADWALFQLAQSTTAAAAADALRSWDCDWSR